MSKSESESELPERLREGGATDLERRLLNAASREQPSRELSERMALGIGISMPPVIGNTPASQGGLDSGAATQDAGTAWGPFVPWVAGAVVVAVIAGVFGAFRPTPVPAAAAVAAPPPPVAPAAAVAPAPTAAIGEPRTDTAQPGERQAAPSSVIPTAQRGRGGPTDSDLREQIALVDAARATLARGNADRALGMVRDYQTRYPSGAFRPEAAAVRVEALVKLGRTAEARASAERFVLSYGPTPLSDRVARLAGLSER
jgi:hypothetical protein